MQTDLSNIQTLSGFLHATDYAFRVFDMGCRLSKLSAQQFAQFEQCDVPYPLPWLKHAWLGFLLWQPKQAGPPQTITQANSSTPIVWFLKWPLDEQGMLIQASRDAFLEQRLAFIHAQMSGVPVADSEAKLPKSELAFTPDQERMAAFHAYSRILLKQPRSNYYQPVVDYFAALAAMHGEEPTAKNSTPSWQHLGVQGFADLSIGLTQDKSLTDQVIQALPRMPLQVLSSLAMQCENQPIPTSLSSAWLSLGQQATDDHEKILCLRAISLAPNQQARKHFIAGLLQGCVLQGQAGDAQTLELLATIASKCQADLADNHDDNHIMVLFLNKCAENTGVFNALVGELMYQTPLRQLILHCVRQPQRSEALAKAFGDFLSAAR